MSREVVEFLSAGTRTGMLGFTASDGRPPVAPAWFIARNGELVLTAGCDGAKGGSAEPDLAHDSRLVVAAAH